MVHMKHSRVTGVMLLVRLVLSPALVVVIGALCVSLAQAGTSSHVQAASVSPLWYETTSAVGSVPVGGYGIAVEGSFREADTFPA
jgi:hypothetical protein